jgi:CYTH domain-containing protein
MIQTRQKFIGNAKDSAVRLRIISKKVYIKIAKHIFDLSGNEMMPVN